MLGGWASHFKRLSESNRGAPGLSELENKVEEMAAKLHANEEGILDCLFTREELGCWSHEEAEVAKGCWP